jgi:hypothetical protein
MLIEEFLPIKLAYLCLEWLKEVKLGSMVFISRMEISFSSFYLRWLTLMQLKDRIVWVYLLTVPL